MSFETPEAVVAELELFIENDGDLYRSQTTSILRALTTKKARGEYKHDLAVKAFEYLVEAGAKKYAKEFGSPGHPWHKMFDVATRRAVAKSFAKSFEIEYALGNYDSLLPKKYQKPQEKAASRQHSTAKTKASTGKWNVPEGLAVRWAPVNNAWFLLWPTSAPLNRQQVLKIADTEEMHDFLRERYGATYGLAARLAHTGRGHATIKNNPAAKDSREFKIFLRNATDRQLHGIYAKEMRAGRYAYAELVTAEADRRGVGLLEDDGNKDDFRRGHATIKKSPSQLNREISEALGSRVRR